MEEVKNNKDTAKEKIILFIIGVLLGAVISTSAFLICANTLGANNNSSNGSSQQMQGGTPPEMPSGENGQGGTPPEMPSGDNNSQNSAGSQNSNS